MKDLGNNPLHDTRQILHERRPAYRPAGGSPPGMTMRYFTMSPQRPTGIKQQETSIPTINLLITSLPLFVQADIILQILLVLTERLHKFSRLTTSK